MPPKTLSQMGSIVNRQKSESVYYRAQVTLTLLGLKKTVHGPLHRCWAMAQKDLEHARTASSHQEMSQLLRALQDDSNQRRAERERALTREAMESSAMEIATNEGDATESIKPSSDVIFIVSDQEEEIA